MKVKLNNAIKMFFGNSSLEMVYFEAVANALDAEATKIDINIELKDISSPESLVITIKDNGVGFTDTRYAKFSNLFDTEDASHKGLGRLVYLCYFEKIRIISIYNNTYQREFDFSDSFEEKNFKRTQVNNATNGTSLSMSGYYLKRIRKNDYVSPDYIKNKILERFYSRLYRLKNNEIDFEISITSNINERLYTVILNSTDIPDFQKYSIPENLDLFSNIELYYSIKTNQSTNKVITSISVDDRSYPIDIIAEENFPVGYDLVFLLYSDYFIGKVDASRECLSIPKSDMESLRSLFRNNIASIIQKEIPCISEINNKRKERLINMYPHLEGYFENDKIGYASQDELLKKAQETFFKDQREILNATNLSEEQYQKSLVLASRTLTEYILFRQNTINKLKAIDSNDNESVIHNLIVPMKKSYSGHSAQNDLYRNNIWVLDDKYMTYDTILSDKEMSKLIEIITEGEDVVEEQGRPDIAIIFSGNPTTGDSKVDVVIIELKKKGLSMEDNSNVEVQLESRARNLLEYYPDKIQQIWFYGIVDFNEKYELHLMTEGYHSLYSNGNVYYRNKDIVIQAKPKITIPAGIYIMDYTAVVNDADVRNSTFLNIIKSKFQSE